MKENKEGINKIRNGCIDFYYSLKVETKLKYKELCKNIRNKISLTIDNYNMQAGVALKENIEKSISKLNFEELKNVKLKTNYENKKKNIKNKDLKDFSQSVKNIRFEVTEKGFKISPILELHEQIKELEDELKSDYNFSSNIYGSAFVDNCQRFYLPPFKIELINNERLFIKAILYVFKNGMMILRISIPIRNLETTPLLENNLDGYIKNIIDEFNVGIYIRENGIEDIKNSYFNYIKTSSKKITNIIFVSETLTNIILADFEGVPNNIRNIPPTIEEDLYRIIVAPINKIYPDSFKDIAKEYLENNSDTYDGVKYITSSMGKCVSVIDRSIVRYLKEKEEIEDRFLYKNIINFIRNNLEFALIIILLKKINSGYTYFKKEMKDNNFYKTQREYLFNNIFILQLQQSSYGSVREQISFLEKKMTYFIASKDTHEKMNAMDWIITEDRARKNLNFQNFLSFCGVLLTTIFGLPAINETLTILKKCLFENTDIPIITIEKSSIIIWGVLVVFLFMKVLFNKLSVKLITKS